MNQVLPASQNATVSCCYVKRNEKPSYSCVTHKQPHAVLWTTQILFHQSRLSFAKLFCSAKNASCCCVTMKVTSAGVSMSQITITRLTQIGRVGTSYEPRTFERSRDDCLFQLLVKLIWREFARGRGKTDFNITGTFMGFKFNTANTITEMPFYMTS